MHKLGDYNTYLFANTFPALLLMKFASKPKGVFLGGEGSWRPTLGTDHETKLRLRLQGKNCCSPSSQSWVRGPAQHCSICIRASNEGFPKVPKIFTITEKVPTRAFFWLKAPTSAFTFKTLLRHYAKRALTPR